MKTYTQNVLIAAVFAGAIVTSAVTYFVVKSADLETFDSIALTACGNTNAAKTGFINFDRASILVTCKDGTHKRLK